MTSGVESARRAHRVLVDARAVLAIEAPPDVPVLTALLGLSLATEELEDVKVMLLVPEPAILKVEHGLSKVMSVLKARLEETKS